MPDDRRLRFAEILSAMRFHYKTAFDFSHYHFSATNPQGN
jgi:hypothetical protein